MLRRLLIVAFLLTSLGVGAPALAQSAPACQFLLGFKTLHDLDPADVGECTDNQAFAANGDAQQHTTNGLLAWRKADNWTAFTNGYWTWVNGPSGLAKRLNTQRFTWEANPAGLPLADPGNASTVVAPTPAPVVTNPVGPAPADDAAWLTWYAAKYTTLAGVALPRTQAAIQLESAGMVIVTFSFDDSAGTGSALMLLSETAVDPTLHAMLVDAVAHWSAQNIVAVDLAGLPQPASSPPADYLKGFDHVVVSFDANNRLQTSYSRGYASLQHFSDLPAGDPPDDLIWRPALQGAGGGTVCADGWVSSSTGRGTCSHHGGESR